MMDDAEREEMAARLIATNRAMRELREEMDVAASVAKAAGATDLAFATYHLSESISVYMVALNNFLVKELKADDADATL